MTGWKRRTAEAVAAVALLATLAGCGPGLLIGAGASAALVASEERTLGRQIDDLGLELSINNRLLQTDERLFRKVEVTAKEGRVLLTGSVPTAEDRVEAARLAWSVDGVGEVLNELQVADASLLDYARDNWIIAQLRGRLVTDGEILDLNYTLDSVNGVIYLIGIAQDDAELQRVINYARTIRGVKKVVSHVRIKGTASRSS